MKENKLLKINRRCTNQVICTFVVDKGRNITKQNFESRDSQNALLSKLSGHIPKFFDTDVSPYGGSDFTVGKGASGEVTLLKIDHMEIVVASKAVSATLKEVKAKIYAMQQVGGHWCIPYVYGIMERGLILIEFIGTIKSGNVMISKTIHSYLWNFVIPKATWFSIVKDVVKAIMFLHSMGLLHNDIHCSNVLITEKFIPKKIDFGKVTLIDAPIFYNLENGSKESEKYNKCHRHLAYEIRNVKGTKQSICTDTYSVDYLLKNIGQYEKIDWLFNVGRELKLNNSCERLTLQDSVIHLMKDD